ncbi:MAG: hypothetical protein LUF89_10355 [Ruminococcus sp.]|nr:hypothetical protein [Ruminococcus sp.]
MKSYRFYVKPKSRLLWIATALSLLTTVNTIYSLVKIESYSNYYDHWIMLVADILLCLSCGFLARKRSEFLLLPVGLLTFVACLSPTLTHWMIVVLFFILLLLLLLRLPKWMRIPFRIIAVEATAIGIYELLVPVLDRIQRLSDQGKLTTDYLVRYIIQTIGGDTLVLLIFLILTFALVPHELPGWQDEKDDYDRIWE